jgi:hypothetical protein
MILVSTVVYALKIEVTLYLVCDIYFFALTTFIVYLTLVYRYAIWLITTVGVFETLARACKVLSPDQEQAISQIQVLPWCT